MRSLIVVGASAGGVPALLQLAAGLPAELPAHVLVVLHIGANRSILPQLMARDCRLPVEHARDGEPVQAGRISVAPPDHHLLVDGDRLRLGRGPKENASRPAIDPLFRSAALAHGPGVVGVVLTGLLDDGTAGLQAVKQCGGVAVVQDPDDAAESSMPLAALRFVEVDHCVPLALMPMLLASLVQQPVGARAAVPDPRLVHEHNVALGKGDPMEELSAIAEPTTFACPDCHGTLWKILDSRPERYRCHTGHAFTLRTLQHALAVASDEAGWNALRSLQERAVLVEHMAATRRDEGDDAEADRLADVAAGLRRQVAVLRALIEDAPDPVE